MSGASTTSPACPDSPSSLREREGLQLLFEISSLLSDSSQMETVLERIARYPGADHHSQPHRAAQTLGISERIMGLRVAKYGLKRDNSWE
jgi:hypothetical protein